MYFKEDSNFMQNIKMIVGFLSFQVTETKPLADLVSLTTDNSLSFKVSHLYLLKYKPLIQINN